MQRHLTLVTASTAALFLSGCAVVHQDQIGLKTTFGRVNPQAKQPGAHGILPGVNGMIRMPARTVNREVRIELPSKEGLNIAAEVSILYRIRSEMAAKIFETGGRNYEDDVVIPVFRSAAADVTARFMAKDMHSGERVAIEKAIKETMSATLDPRGFIVENVLLKSIRLPADLARAVEAKLEAEQRSEQMRFVLDRERQEADRRKIEAAGIRDAQQIIGAGLTPMLLSFQSIEAFRELARSPNAKVIVTDGRSPFLISQDLSSTIDASSGTPPAGPSAAPAREVRGLPRVDPPRQP